MKFILSLILILTGILQCQSQSIHFDYDANGNRIHRNYLCCNLERKNPDKVEIPASTDSLMVLANEGDSIPDSLGTTVSYGANGIVSKSNGNGHENSGIAGITQTSIGEQTIAIYPNPTMGRLTIGLKNFEEVQSIKLKITDSFGKLVKESMELKQVYQYDMSEYPSGNYYIDLTVNGVTGYYTVVKQ